MVWNYHDDDVPAPPATVSLDVQGLPADQVQLVHYRIDEEHSNSYTVWRRMGAPQQVTREQYRKLDRSGHLDLYQSPRWTDVSDDGDATLALTLPRQGVSLMELSW